MTETATAARTEVNNPSANGVSGNYLPDVHSRDPAKLPSPEEIVKFPTPPSLVKWSKQFDKKGTGEAGWYIELSDIIYLLNHYIPSNHIDPPVLESDPDGTLIASVTITTFHEDGSINRRVSAIASVPKANKNGTDHKAPGRVQGYAIKKAAFLLGIGADKDRIGAQKVQNGEFRPGQGPVHQAYAPRKPAQQQRQNDRPSSNQRHVAAQGRTPSTQAKGQSSANQPTEDQRTGYQPAHERTPPAQAIRNQPAGARTSAGQSNGRQPAKGDLAAKRRQLLGLAHRLGMTETEAHQRIMDSSGGLPLEELAENQLDYLVNLLLHQISKQTKPSAV